MEYSFTLLYSYWFNDETDWLIAWQVEARLGGRAKQNTGKKKGGVFRATKDAK